MYKFIYIPSTWTCIRLHKSIFKVCTYAAKENSHHTDKAAATFRILSYVNNPHKIIHIYTKYSKIVKNRQDLKIACGFLQ